MPKKLLVVLTLALSTASITQDLQFDRRLTPQSDLIKENGTISIREKEAGIVIIHEDGQQERYVISDRHTSEESKKYLCHRTILVANHPDSLAANFVITYDTGMQNIYVSLLKITFDVSGDWPSASLLAIWEEETYALVRD